MPPLAELVDVTSHSSAVSALPLDVDTYRRRRPWRYDARFHVAPQHVHHCPVFLEPPETPYGRELRESTP